MKRASHASKRSDDPKCIDTLNDVFFWIMQNFSQLQFSLLYPVNLPLEVFFSSIDMKENTLYL